MKQAFNTLHPQKIKTMDKTQCCPLCKGKGKIKKPDIDNRTAREKKVAIINDLRNRGYTIREIMIFFGYRSTSAIAHYLTSSPKNKP